jgi:hypothetical protein
MSVSVGDAIAHSDAWGKVRISSSFGSSGGPVGKAGEGAVGPLQNAREGEVGQRAPVRAQGDQLQLLPPRHRAVLGMRPCGDDLAHSAARAFLDLAGRIHGGGPPELLDRDGQRDQGAESVVSGGELPSGPGMAAFLRSAGPQNRGGGRNDT